MNPYYKKNMYFIYIDKTCQGFKVTDVTTEKKLSWTADYLKARCFDVLCRLSLEFADKLF